MPAFFARAAPQFGRFSRAFSKMPMASVPRAAAQARNGLRLAVGRCDRLAVPAAPALAVSAPGASLTARGLSGTALVSAATGTAAASESSTSTAKKVKHNTNSVELTVDHFPELNLKRLPFARLEDSDVAFFTSLLGPAGVITDADELPRYNTDWMQKYRGQSSLVLRPKTTQEVAGIVKYCNDRRLAVVPQGGNTGLVGGSVPVFDEIVISLERVNNIRSFDAVSGILVADAGVILENADKYLADRGFIFPLDLGAKGTCHIGGNVATNAGGLRLLRYGSLHGSVLGLEAVLPDGTVLDTLSTLRKDNTGYDLKQLFIGSEGTLGVITGISIATPKRSSAVNVSMVAVKSFEDVQKVFLKAKEGLGEILSAFEFWDGSATKMVGEKLDGVRNPLGEREDAPFTILIETSGSIKDHDDEKLSMLLSTLMESELIVDGVLAESSTQFSQFWHVREGIPLACGKAGAVYKYDVSIPLDTMYNLVEDCRARLAELGLYKPNDSTSAVTSVVGYGHVGDSNLHLNVAAPVYTPELTAALEPWVYEWVSKQGGSISAEHGLGLMKGRMIGYSKTDGAVEMMKRVKNMLDPNGIMNPYKFLPM